MSLLPIFVKLEGRQVVVIGGGEVAAGKINGLLQANAKVRVIAPEAVEQIREMAAEKRLEWKAKRFEAGDLDGGFLVITATSAAGVNETVFREAERRGILCNAVDDVEHCHFYYGAVVQRGDLQVAISTNGKSPALAQRLREELETEFGAEYEVWVQWLGAAREALRTRDKSSVATKRLLHELASRTMFERFVAQAMGPCEERRKA